jgi:quinol monooxygenase YgiN
VAIKTIIEFQAKPGQRDELIRLLREHIAAAGRPPGFLGETWYEALGDPDGLIGIAEWESPEAREAYLAQAQQSGALAPIVGLLGAPFRATNVRPLPSSSV